MPLYIVSVLLMVLLDQAVKYWAFTVVKAQATLPVVDGIFHFTYVENRGAAFSLFERLDSPWIFAVLAVIVSVMIFVVLKRGLVQTSLGRLSLVLILSGALGNAVDRITHGFVIDMFDFRFINFPVFNVADILICTGGVLFVWYVMFQHQDGQKTEQPEKPETHHE